MTFEVLKLLKSSFSKLSQPPNILLMVVALLVSVLRKSTLVRFLQPLKKLEKLFVPLKDTLAVLICSRYSYHGGAIRPVLGQYSPLPDTMSVPLVSDQEPDPFGSFPPTIGSPIPISSDGRSIVNPFV